MHANTQRPFVLGATARNSVANTSYRKFLQKAKKVYNIEIPNLNLYRLEDRMFRISQVV